MNHHVRNAINSTRDKAPKWLDRFARFGIIAKGVVYVLVGVLAAMSVFGQWGAVGDQGNAFEWVLDQPFGQILLGLVIIGLLCYVGWRMFMAFKDPDGEGSDAKAMIKRVGYFFSGLTYLFFAFLATRLLLPELTGGSSGNGGEEGRQLLLAKALDQPFGQLLIGLLAAIILAKGVYELYRAFKSKFETGVNERFMTQREHEIYKKTGRMGYAARGVIFGVVGYFLVKVALDADADAAGGTGEALNFLEQSGGPYLMALVALGFACYGVFMFVRSKYRYIPPLTV
jgi:hypothetical protein